MIVSIAQPAYLPWLGYFDRVVKSDLAVVLDSVQIERKTKTAFSNRNRIRTSSGWSWLSIPLATAGLGQPLIRNVKVDNTLPWKAKHWKSLCHSYSRAKYFKEYSNWLEGFYQSDLLLLTDVLSRSTEYLMQSLGIETQMVSSSRLNVPGSKSELVLNICKAVGATVYLSGPFGRDYLDVASFRESGIELKFHDYIHPVYIQAYPGFASHLSIVDLLFNYGPNSLGILSNG
jgi:hypothetical protein